MSLVALNWTKSYQVNPIANEIDSVCSSKFYKNKVMKFDTLKRKIRSVSHFRFANNVCRNRFLFS